jgi:NTP pyrophosphatase (non-canonical NTP hydrolase)
MVVSEKQKGEIADGLLALAEVQEFVSGHVPSANPVTGNVGSEQVLTYGFALLKEVTELMDELQWKSWKPRKAVDTARAADEFADILAFLGLYVHYMRRLAGLAPEDLAAAYARKSQVNVDRFTGKVVGYRVEAVDMGNEEDGERFWA